MSRCLITGGSGFIFSNVLEYLLEHTNLDFVLICSWRHQGNPLRIKKSRRVKVITHDLVGPIPDIGDFDYIIHGASESHVDRSIAEPVAFIENNVSSTLQVFEYARKHPPKSLILFSTDEVYGAMNHKEWDVLLPSNPYAASKAAQEMIAIAYWKTYGLPIVITNSNNIVGPGQDPEKFVPKIIAKIKAGEVVQIHISKGKPGKRFWNPVENVASALLFILEHQVNLYPITNRPDRHALTGGEELNNLEMAQLIADRLDKPLKYELIDAETIRPGYDEFYAKTVGIVGWEPPVTLEESLSWVK